MQRLEGQVALITGGARGQGRAIALKFASEGAQIVTCDICRDIDSLAYSLSTEADLQETVELVENLDQRCHAAVADVRDQAALDRVVEEGIAEFGKIDIMVANAGIGNYKPFWELTDKEWSDRIVGHSGATREEYLASVRHWHALRGRTALPPEAIADAMIWLVSAEARHVTGVELIIDAGHNILPGYNLNPVQD